MTAFLALALLYRLYVPFARITYFHFRACKSSVFFVVTGLQRRFSYYSSFVVLYNGLKVKRNSHFTFESALDSWGTCSDENINSGTILSFDVICMGSPVIIMY